MSEDRHHMKTYQISAKKIENSYNNLSGKIILHIQNNLISGNTIDFCKHVIKADRNEKYTNLLIKALSPT